MAQEPRTLIEAVRYFSDPDVALAYMVELRWPGGVHCPTCGRTDVRFIPTRRLWECKEKHPRKQFSAKVGTIFEDSAIPLEKWFVAIWLIANAKNGISSYEMGRSLGVTQKTAWHMDHRIRLAMEVGSIDIEKLRGDVELDETYVGGKASNRHKGDPKNAPGTAGKVAVIGALERGGKAVAAVIQNTNTATLDGFAHDVISPDATSVSTDEHSGYRFLDRTFFHGAVRHSAGEYVNEQFHTNSIEGFWALLKRSIKGTYISVEGSADRSKISNEWLDAHIRKGPLGALYPKAAFIMEGDTPAFLGLTANGLDSAMSPAWGGWGGRYVYRRAYGETRPIWTQGGFPLYGLDSRDEVTGIDGRPVRSDQATIWRWRDAYQNDFAARIDWTTKPFAAANHQPIAVINSSSGTAPIILTAHPGSSIDLDASSSRDPDRGQRLSFRWYVYREAGTSLVPPADVTIASANLPRAKISVARSCMPAVPGMTAPCGARASHVILEVTDDGTPSLTSYRRIIVNIAPEVP